jgi:hypothetical protein
VISRPWANARYLIRESFDAMVSWNSRTVVSEVNWMSRYYCQFVGWVGGEKSTSLGPEF